MREGSQPTQRVYPGNVREIERRIQAIETYNTNNPTRVVPTAPVGVPDSWDDHAKLMMDLMALGFAADVTRVSTLKLGRDTSNRVFPESGSTTPFHSASHHQVDIPSSMARSRQDQSLSRWPFCILPRQTEEDRRR